MKKILTWLFLSATAAIFFSCSTTLETEVPGAISIDLVDDTQYMLGDTIPIKIHITNPSQGAYSSVKLMANTQVLETIPSGQTEFLYKWVTGTFDPADYTIKVIAISGEGATTKSVSITLSSFNLSLVSPNQPEFFINKPMPIQINVESINYKLKKIEFYLDSKLLKYLDISDGTGALSIIYTPNSADMGNHNIIIKAHSQTGKIIQKSTPIKFSKYGLIIAMPEISQRWKGETVNVVADVSDSSRSVKNKSVKKVRFYVDNVLLFTDETVPYTFNWNTTSSTISVGNHSIRANLVSDLGLEYSDSVSVLLSKADLQITSPESDKEYVANKPIPITALVNETSNSFQTRMVNFYIDDVLKDSLAQSPFTYTWTPTQLQTGLHTIIVEAVSNYGLVMRDTCKNVKISYRPTDVFVTLLSPISNDSLAIGTDLVIKVGINDKNRQFKKIEYYVNDVLQGADSSIAYVPQFPDSIYKTKTINTENFDETIYKVEARIIPKAVSKNTKSIKKSAQSKENVSKIAYIRMYEYILTFDNYFDGAGYTNYIPNYIIQTADKGFLLIAVHGTTNATKVIKLKNDGAVDWQKDFPSANNSEVVSSVIEDINYNTGFVLTGYKADSVNPTLRDTWVRKIDKNGNLVWQKNYGFPGIDDIGIIVKQTKDNGFIIGGVSKDMVYGTLMDLGKDTTVYMNRPTSQIIRSGWDVRLLKLYSNGNEVWGYNHNFIGTDEWQDTASIKFLGTDSLRYMISMGNQWITDLQVTEDNNYVVTGWCDWAFHMRNANKDKRDMFYSKFDQFGVTTKTNTWSRMGGYNFDNLVNTRPYSVAFGDPAFDEEGKSLTVSNNKGEYVIAGYASETDTKKGKRKSKGKSLLKDAWLVDYTCDADDDGVLWETTIGSADVNDEALDVAQVRNGGYIACGYKTGTNNVENFWLYKASNTVQMEWDKVYPPTNQNYNSHNRALLVKQTSDGGFIAAGYATNSIGEKVIRLKKVKKSGVPPTKK